MDAFVAERVKLGDIVEPVRETRFHKSLFKGFRRFRVLRPVVDDQNVMQDAWELEAIDPFGGSIGFITWIPSSYLRVIERNEAVE